MESHDLNAMEMEILPILSRNYSNYFWQVQRDRKSQNNVETLSNVYLFGYSRWKFQHHSYTFTNAAEKRQLFLRCLKQY